jgi:hypothetical protein
VALGGEAGARAGAGGEACALDVLAACNDADPCMDDVLDVDCTCQHLAVPDGTRCDDGNVCSDADQCKNGVCKGTPRATTPEVVSQLRSFGENPGLQTLVTFPSAQRALFAREKRLTLLALDGNGASVLDDVSMSASVRSDSVGAMVWVSRPRTFLIPVLEHHVAVASIDRGIDLFDLAGDKIVASETYGFGGSGWQIAAVTGAGQRLYACTAYQVQTWNVNPSSYLISAGPTLSLGAGHRCQGLSLAPEGNVLYAATSGGLEQISIASDGGLTLAGEARTGNLVVDVQAGAERLALFEILDSTSGFGNVVVLRRDTLEEESTIGSASLKGAYPVGFSMLDGGRMLLQTLRTDAMNCAVQEAVTFSLAKVPLELARRTTFSACESPFATPSYHTVANGGFAALEPMHQLVRIDPSGALVPLSSLQQGSFERVRAGSAGSVLAYSPGSVHRVDITDPKAPHVVSGGLASPVAFERLRLDVSDPNQSTILTVAETARGGPNGPVTSVLRSTGEGLPALFATIANDDAESFWVAQGSSIYQLSPEGSANFRLRRFATTAIAQSSKQSLAAELEQELTTKVPAELDVRSTALFALDPAKGDLFVLEARSNSRATASDTPVLSRFGFDGGQFQTNFSVALDPGIATDVAAASGRVLAIVSGKLLSFSAEGVASPIALVGVTPQRILQFDASKLVLAASWSSPSAGQGVLVLRAGDCSELARYTTSEPALSFAEASNHWVFGARSALFLATPVCAATP